MSGSQFIPNTRRNTEGIAPSLEQTEYQDTQGLSSLLLSTAQYAVIAVVALIPIFFIPQFFGTLGFTKLLAVITLGVVVVVAMSLTALRRKQVVTVAPLPLAVYVLFLLSASASALLSGDSLDAFRGSNLETQTVGFLAVMGMLMLMPLVFQNAKRASMKLLMVFGLSGALLLLYVIVRMIFGADFLSFGSFQVLTASPIGSFNDLALFAGMLVIASLITLAQLPIKGVLQYMIGVLLLLALAVLSVVNFFNIWIVLGFVGLLLLMYLISRDTLFANNSQNQPPVSRLLILLTAIVCVTSTVFIVSGGSLSERIGEMTGISYVEVRPSFEATTNIMRAVYSENALLGIGPNRFADAWRLYKDVSINETIFWDTNFNSGNGFVSTVFVNTGLLGGLLLLIFHGWFVWFGTRMLLRTENQDRYWYFFGLLSFALAFFIWVMSYLYVPGTAILLLAAFFTGCTFAAGGALLPSTQITVGLATNQRRGFLLMSCIILIITGSVAALYSAGEQYVAQARFNKSQLTAPDIVTFEQVAQQSFEMYPDDRFLQARAQIQLATLNALLNLENAGEAEQQRFIQAAPLAIQLSEAAVRADNTNPANHAIVGSVYGALSVAGVEDTMERSAQAFSEAKRLDPLNPVYYLLDAQIAVRMNDVESARTALNESLSRKRNFTDALFLSSQLDINEGDIESAIAATRSIISLEPNNPARYYQLGILLAANEQVEDAILAYERALQLDPQYANARYMLALVYLSVNREEDALNALRIVAETNQENQQLQALITQIESGEYEVPQTSDTIAPVEESSSIENIDETVVTDGDITTDLLTPVNTVGESSNNASETEQATETELTTNDTATSTE